MMNGHRIEVNKCRCIFINTIRDMIDIFFIVILIRVIGWMSILSIINSKIVRYMHAYAGICEVARHPLLRLLLGEDDNATSFLVRTQRYIKIFNFTRLYYK